MSQDLCASLSRLLITSLARMLALGDHNISVNKYNHEWLRICWNTSIVLSFLQDHHIFITYYAFDFCLLCSRVRRRGSNPISSPRYVFK